MRFFRLLTLTLISVHASGQSQNFKQGSFSMEIKVQRWEGNAWKTVDPGLVFATDDRIRLHFRTTFDGFIFVSQQTTSGKYEQLFPRAETGRNNRVEKNTENTIPATDTVFRIAGPPGHDIIYWLMSPVNLAGTNTPYVPLPPPPPSDQALPADMTPRCDGEILRARGDCVDSSAGPQSIAEKDKLPSALDGSTRSRDLLFLRKQDSTVVASGTPLSGPVVYQLRLAHK